VHFSHYDTTGQKPKSGFIITGSNKLHMRNDPTIRTILIVLLGIGFSRVFFELVGFNYSLFRDPFVFWKVVLKFSSPVAFTLSWYWVFQVFLKPGRK
jgi:hypothetical protein